jgi:sialidase-1
MLNTISVILLLGLPTAVLPAADPASPIHRFVGGESPVKQGWIETHDKPREAVAKPAGSAWRVEDDDDGGPEGLYYRAELTDEQRDLARRDGFVYRWRVRIPEETNVPTRAIGTEVCVWRKDKTQRLRFSAQLGRAGDQLLARIHTGTHGSVEGAVRADEPDAFHNWELMFEGTSRTINLRVDSQLVISAQCDHDDSGHHLVFGSRSTGIGVAEWERVEFFAGLPKGAKISAPPAPPFRTEVYVSGRDDYFAYRIPSLLATPKSTLLAFAEGRKTSLADLGNNDMVLKRSTDGGETWGPLQIIYDEGESTIGNPTPVIDRDTGRIWLVFGREAKQVLVMHSDDDGQTWTEAVDITTQVTKPEWKFYGVGPGIGVQLREGAHRGRIVIPGYHRLTEHKGSSPYAHVFFSDDHGESWSVSDAVGPELCECQVAETAGGGLLLNARNHWRRTGKQPERGGKRIVTRSEDGGKTWSKPTLDATLIEPTCQASLLRYSWPGDGSRSRLLFANPAATPTSNWGGPRHRLTVRMSYDDGRTWPVSKLIEPGPAAYSSLARLADGRIGVLYESGGYKQLTFAAFDLKWLGEGQP